MMQNDDDTNLPPTKAIAVSGSEGESASRIVAKGEGELAEKILDFAFAEGIKVRQDKDLTELLDAFEIESPIPLEALNAVSLILERVYTENAKLQEAKFGAEPPTETEAPTEETEE